MARPRIEPTTELGWRLEQWREDQRITRDEASTQLGVRPATYIDWLRGQHPEWPNLAVIATVLGVSAGEVFEWITVAADRTRAMGVYVASWLAA